MHPASCSSCGQVRRCATRGTGCGGWWAAGTKMPGWCLPGLIRGAFPQVKEEFVPLPSPGPSFRRGSRLRWTLPRGTQSDSALSVRLGRSARVNESAVCVARRAPERAFARGVGCAREPSARRARSARVCARSGSPFPAARGSASRCASDACVWRLGASLLRLLFARFGAVVGGSRGHLRHRSRVGAQPGPGLPGGAGRNRLRNCLGDFAGARRWESAPAGSASPWETPGLARSPFSTSVSPSSEEGWGRRAQGRRGAR